MPSTPISVCIICFNEEARIEDCLKSVAPCADEIVVVDSRSTDGTVDICKRYTDKIFVHSWPGYVAQKNYALGKAAHDWVLCLDADERVSDDLREEVLMIKSHGPDAQGYDGYYLPRKTMYLGRWMKHSGWYPDYKLRVFDKRKGQWEGTEPHDIVRVKGQTGYLTGDILHYSFTGGISHHLRKIDHFTTIAAQEAFSKGRRSGPGDLLAHPLFIFMKMYIRKAGFLDGVPGLIAAGLSAFHVFSKYSKLWELQRKKGSGRDL